jgi:nonsense-mediated mRNA decay protein 3
MFYISFSPKQRIQRRKWKLKRMQVENEEGLIRVKDTVKDEQDFNDFQDDLEEDPDLRREVNLYKDPDRIRAANADGEENEENKMNDSDEEDSESDSDDVPEVPLAELLDGLHINEDSDEDDEEGLICPDGSKIPACPMSDDDDI